MSGGTQGYTILETMIFLAVSAFMFIIAASFISGKQAHVEFIQGMSAINSNVQDVINDVNNGYYPSANNFSCTSDDEGDITITSPVSADKGTNLGCIFLGKVIQFSPDSVGSSYDAYTVVGSRLAADGTVVTNFAEAQPKAVDGSVYPVNLTQLDTLEDGVQVTKVFSGPAKTPIVGVGFFGSFGSYDDSGSGALNSGSQSTIVVPIVGTGSLNDNRSSMASTYIPNQVTDANVVSNPDISVCLDGGKGLYGILTIGGTNGERLTTGTQIYTDQSSWQGQGC
jgi:hypothetical protein